MASSAPSSSASTSARRAELAKRLFARLDADANGLVSEAEIVAEFAALGVSLSADDARKLLAFADADGSADLDESEYAALLAHLGLDNAALEILLETKIRRGAQPPARDGDGVDREHELRLLVARAWLDKAEFGRPGSSLYIHVQAPDSSKVHVPIFDGAAIKTLAAGGLAGAVSRTVVAPLERVKILLQTQPRDATGAVRYRGTWHAITTILRDEGPRGLVRGNAANVVRIVPASAIQFFAFAKYKLLIAAAAGEQSAERLSPLQLLAAGSLAGATSLACTYPLELVRARMSVTSAAQLSTGLVGTLRAIVVKDGLAGAYKGFVPSVLGIVPYVGVDFAAYESLKLWAARRKQIAAPGVEPTVDRAEKLLYGGIAGLAGQTIAFPLDTIRRRIQTDASYLGMRDCAQRVWRSEGWRGFFRGLNANILKAVPAVAVSFLVFDEAMAVLKDL